MSNPVPSPGNRPLDQLKVAELRDELRKRGLSLKGVKKDLFERLDEAVRKEQTGDNEVQGGYSSGIPPYQGETSQEDDGMSYLNDGENTQDPPLIVNNASPYVGASDATPVFMEPRKDVDIERLPSMEEKKDDSSIGGGSPLPEVTNYDEIMLDSNNLASTENAVPEAGKEVTENVTESGNQGSGSETVVPDLGTNQATEANITLPGTDSHDTIALSHVAEGGVSEVTIVTQVVESTSVTVALEPADGDLSTPAGDDIVAGESAVSARELSGAEVESMSDVVIEPEGDKDVPSASVSDDILNAADASVPAVDTVVNASDSPMQDVEVFERNVLTSVSVVPCVQEPGKEPDGGAHKVGISEKAMEELVEDTKESTFQDGGDCLETVAAASEVPMVEARQGSRLLAPEDVHAIPILDAPVLQEEKKDIEMSEVHEDLSVKLEVDESKFPAAVSEAHELPVAMKSEDGNNAGVASTENFREASRSRVIDEAKLSVKSETREPEPRVSRKATPVEVVKLEQLDNREESPKNGRSFERSRPRDYESDRPRNSSARTHDERGRFEGRSGRHFKEEVRKDAKETVLKPEEGTDLHIGHKRKDEDRDARQQEPAKRVRRWNAGSQPALEITKPLTSGSVDEIVSPEVKKEDLAVVPPPKVTPRLSGPVRPVAPVAKSGFEANGDKRAVPPSARTPSASLKIERFVRPFTLKAVKDLLAEFGECVDFWMDQIKTHCYVTYSKVEEAVAARNGLYDRQWPPSFGNLLVADFVEATEVKIRSDGTFEKMSAPASTTPRGFPNHSPALGTMHGHPNTLVSVPPLRERQFVQAPIKDPEPPVPTLDDLFRRTTTKPHIYYLPLTDEQVAEKLAAAKNKDQQLVRGRPVGRV
ncbi:hypothetical protein L7F22_065413 [Adiantum nelumboides]|nr:hypothetical protein [Adiantum nelumboides]